MQIHSENAIAHPIIVYRTPSDDLRDRGGRWAMW